MNLSTKTDDEIVSIATPIMDNLMDASININYKAHVRDFYQPISEEFTEAAFRKQCEDFQSKWGLFTNREYFGITRKNGAVNVYWKQNCSKTTDELLAILSLSVQGSRCVVQRAFLDLWQPKT